MRERRPTLFADTSDIQEARQLMDLGIFSGITTNPLIVAKEAGNSEPHKYYQRLAEAFPNVPVSVQLLDADVPTLVAQANDFAAISPNIFIKVPMFGDGRGLKVIHKLAKESPEININVTGLINAEQALLAWFAGNRGKNRGPTYLSLFFNRIKDGGGNPQKEIKRTRNFIELFEADSEIIAGSIRKGEDVYQAAIAGAHIVTVTPNVIWQMIPHPKTTEFIEQSQEAWENLVSMKK